MLIVSKRLTPAFKKTLISAPKPQYVPETSLCDWIIREVAMQDYGMLLCINRNTQMPIVLPGAEFLKVSPVSVLRQVLMFVMAGMGISSIKLTEYVNCIAHGEVSYQNMTADFLVEKAFRAYAPELAKIDVERLDDDQLLNQLGILSLTLGSSTKVFCDLREPKIAPVKIRSTKNGVCRLKEKAVWQKNRHGSLIIACSINGMIRFKKRLLGRGMPRSYGKCARSMMPFYGAIMTTWNRRKWLTIPGCSSICVWLMFI